MIPGQVIRLSKSCIGDAERRAVIGVLDREYLGMGAEVQQFEQALTEFFGRPAVCVVNGTAALHLALQACGIGRGDEVLVPSLTYVASFQAISATGATPIACDIDPDTLTLDWRDAEKRLSPNTKAVMPVHYSGGVGALDEIYAFAHKHGLRVIEDAAHAFGTVYHGKQVGGFGDIACFSFDGIKNITSGEGGCITASDEAVLQRIRDARLLGVEKDTEMRYSGGRSWEFQVRSQGWRFHMSNIMASIGLAQLQRSNEFSKKRRKLAISYDRLLSKYPRIKIINHDYRQIVPHIYVIRVSGLASKDELRSLLLAQNIQTGIHYMPNHWLDLYKKPPNYPNLSSTEQAYREILSLPLHADMTMKEVKYICETLIGILDKM